jgi:Fic/DOC family
MISFRARRLQELRLSARTVRLMMDITELKGHQQLQARLAKQFLRAFRLAALVRGVESAKRIEGVAVQSGRLLPLYHVKPNNQSEIETLGFCRALDESIYTKTSGFEITPMYLQMLHQTILGGIRGAGQWRAEKSDEIQFGDGDTPGIMVESVSGAEVPGSVEELLRSYRDVQAEADVHPLLATAVLVLDFLCLHPFYRGNLRIGEKSIARAFAHFYSRRKREQVMPRSAETPSSGRASSGRERTRTPDNLPLHCVTGNPEPVPSPEAGINF